MSDPVTCLNYVIVAGSRTFRDYPLMVTRLQRILHRLDPASSAIVSGMAKGADTLALRYAREHGHAVIEMPADWAAHGKVAGYRRNDEMAQIATHVVVFRVGGAASPGSTHMIALAQRRGLPLRVIEC